MPQNKGLSRARNPGSISQEEHNDATGANRSGNGELLAVDRVITPSTTATNLGINQSTLRVCNTGTAIAYLWAGKEKEVPTTVDITNGIALPPNYVTMIFVEGSDDDMQAMMVKTSNAAVQVVLMKP